MEAGFNLNLLSKYRAELMGVATIMILLCHAPGNGVELHPVVARLLAFGNLGVEMFLLLSGMGLYYSLEAHKATHGRLGQWYGKRFLRLFVPYLFIAIPLYAYTNIHEGTGIGGFLIDVSTLNWWLYGKWFWFFAFLIPLYAITPFLYGLISIGGGKTLVISVFSALFLVSVICVADEGVLRNVIYVVRRIPCFVIGLLAASSVKQGKTVSILCMVAVIAICGIVLFCLSHETPYWLFVFPIIWFVCWLLERIKVFSSMLCFFGAISLESYLLNVALPVFRDSADLAPMGAQYMIKLMAGTLLAYCISRISKPIIRRVKTRYMK